MLVETPFRVVCTRTSKNGNLPEFSFSIVNFMFELKNILLRNMYAGHFIDSMLRNYLNEKLTTGQKQVNDGITPRFYKLPYIGEYSGIAQKKINSLIKKYCKDSISVKISFSGVKLASFFSTKDKIPENLRSNVVYKFVCAGCNASYVGETQRHLTTRIKEHLETDKCSHIYRHVISSPVCKELTDSSSFSILDNANSEFTLKLKEGLHIAWERPSLNKQVKSVLSSICV